VQGDELCFFIGHGLMENSHGLLFDACLMATIQPSFADATEFFNSLLQTSQPSPREFVMFSHDPSAKRQN